MTYDNLTVARYIAVRKAPYFAHALFKAPIIATPAVPVAAMDMHGRLYINPQVVKEWKPEHIATVLVHEMFHLLNEHFARKGARDQKRWNIATDLEIANILRSMDFRLDTPIPHTTPEQYNLPNDLLAEEYYDRLKSKTDTGGNDKDETDDGQSSCSTNGHSDNFAGQPDSSKDGHPSGSASDGIEKPWELPLDDTEYPGLSDTEQEILRREVAHAIETHYKDRGDLPMQLERLVKRYKKRNEVNWRELLRRYVKRTLVITGHGDHYTYRRPNRRKQQSNFIFPSLAHTRPEIAVVIDTSGSMNDAELNTAINEVDALLRELRSEVTVLSVDAAVHTTQRIRSTRQIKLEGGGGTDMMCGIRAATQLKPTPHAIIVITDGYTPWSETQPRNTPPVIAVLTDANSKEPPRWIRSVRVKIE
jgi:predicted metal-dependent peptidase